MIGRRNGVIGLIVFLGGISHVYAQDNLDDRVAELVRESALRVGQAPQSRRFDLTLDDAIQRALDRNLDIAVERIDPLVVDLTLAQQQAFYRPTLSFNYDTSSVTTPSSTQLDGGVFTVTDQANYNTSVNQPVKWGGGSLNVSFDNNRRESSSFFQSFNPSFRTVFTTQYTQPLLRGFKTDNNRQQIQVTQINRDISDVDLRQTITNTVADVRNAYWELLYTVASVAVQQQALDLAEQLVQDNRARVEIGTLAPIDIVQAQSEAASRRQTLAAAQQALRSAELTLKRLIVAGTQDELWTDELNPVDQPQRSQPPVDIEAAIRKRAGWTGPTWSARSVSRISTSSTSPASRIRRSRPSILLAAISSRVKAGTSSYEAGSWVVRSRRSFQVDTGMRSTRLSTRISRCGVLDFS